MRNSLAIAAVVVAVFVFIIPLALPLWDRVSIGSNDFVAFYSGGRLAFTSDLYDREKIREVQIERVRITGEAWRFIRPPYYAAFFWPLAQFPYLAAYYVWQALSLTALLLFVLLWDPRARAITASFVAWNPPVIFGILNGQDLTFLLLWVALAARLNARSNSVLAGAVLGLGAAKPHLFALLPVLILAQRRWKLASGLAGCGAILLLASFWAGGIDWPARYYQVLTDPAIHPGTATMPNLRALLSLFRAPHFLEWIGIATVAFLVWLAARRGSFEWGLGAVLAGGLLVGFHTYLADCTVVLPAAAMLVLKTDRTWIRYLCLLLLSPVPYFPLIRHFAGPVLIPLLVLSLLVAMALNPVPRKGEEPRM